MDGVLDKDDGCFVSVEDISPIWVLGNPFFEFNSNADECGQKENKNQEISGWGFGLPMVKGGILPGFLCVWSLDGLLQIFIIHFFDKSTNKPNK